MTALKIGAATVDISARTIEVGDRSNRVTPKSMKVLTALLEARGEAVSRDALLGSAWSDIYVGEEVLTQAIRELRRAFGDAPRAARYIETVPKFGYRLLPQAEALSSSPSALQEARTGAQSLDALLAFLTANDLLERRGRNNIEDAIRLFEETIEREPDFAPAHAGLSFALAYRQNFYRQTKTAPQRALACAQKAVSLDRMAPEGYLALAYALSQIGEFDHAMTSFNASIRLQANSYYALNRLGITLYMKRDYANALLFFDRASSLDGGRPHSLILSEKALRAAGDHERADARLRRAIYVCDQSLESDPADLRATICKAYSLIKISGAREASTLIDRLIDEERPFTYYLLGALVHAGEKSVALDRLKCLAENGWSQPAFLRADRELDPLRAEPRFKKIEQLLAA